MRRLSRAAIAVVLALIWQQPVFATDPDDQPWDEIDRVLREDPQNVTPDTEAAAATPSAEPDWPGGPDRDPERGIENDRQHADRTPWPSDDAGGDPSDDRLAPIVPKTPTTVAAPQPPIEIQQDKSIAPAANAAAPAIEVPAQTAMKETTATDGAAAAPATPPAQTPAAAPPAPVTVAADQLFLPVRNYFETKAVVTLRDYDEADRTTLKQFYEARMGQALWMSKSGLTPAGEQLRAELAKADDWGLSSKDLLLPNLDLVSKDGASDEDRAEAEIKLSLAALLYARHARGGRIANPTEQLSSYIDRKPQLLEPSQVIDALSAAPDKAVYLRSLNPKHPQFERLRLKLVALRAGGEPEPLAKIPTTGPKLTAGKSHPHIALVRERLKVPSPGLKPDGTAADDNYYDEALARAVIQFKEKHELEPYTATITNALRNALNRDDSVSEEILLANMEQWRWMPDDLGAKHIEVNVPEFSVRVVKDNAIIHDERIVSGRYETQTPLFSDRMKTIVFNPSWIVPHSIMVNELLPKLRAGGNPIARQGLEIKRNDRLVDAMDVNWNRTDIRLYHVYQTPGPSNVLGVVKFLFPNKHAVYLHDTPSKSLFNARVRTFSHGCVRVRNPVALAEVILAEDKGWDAAKVTSLVGRGPGDNDISLDTPMPVHIMYFTAWVDDDGSVKTFQDVYGHQKRVTLALAGRFGEIVKNRDHLLPPDVSKVPVARSRFDADDPDGWSQRRDRDPRLTYRVPPPNTKKQKQSVGDMLQQVFGGY